MKETENDYLEGLLITIDTGIGKIQYLEPDNLKLQIFMEELKEKLERDGI